MGPINDAWQQDFPINCLPGAGTSYLSRPFIRKTERLHPTPLHEAFDINNSSPSPAPAGGDHWDAHPYLRLLHDRQRRIRWIPVIPRLRRSLDYLLHHHIGRLE